MVKHFSACLNNFDFSSFKQFHKKSIKCKARDCNARLFNAQTCSPYIQNYFKNTQKQHAGLHSRKNTQNEVWLVCRLMVTKTLPNLNPNVTWLPQKSRFSVANMPHFHRRFFENRLSSFCVILLKTSCARGRTICPRPCTPQAPTQLQPIHALRLRRPAMNIHDRQAAARSGYVSDVVHIKYVLTWTANQSGLVTLTFDLLTLKVVSESRVTWATSVPILVSLGLSVLELGPIYATDVRQTDVRRQTKASLNASAH